MLQRNNPIALMLGVETFEIVQSLDLNFWKALIPLWLNCNMIRLSGV